MAFKLGDCINLIKIKTLREESKRLFKNEESVSSGMGGESYNGLVAWKGGGIMDKVRQSKIV